MNMEEDILTQDEDLLEEEMKREEAKKAPTTVKPQKKVVRTPIIEAEEGVHETYEGFRQEERLGIVNTLTGEVIEGFDSKKDQGIVKLGQAILNHLNKISIASGVQ